MNESKKYTRRVVMDCDGTYRVEHVEVTGEHYFKRKLDAARAQQKREFVYNVVLFLVASISLISSLTIIWGCL